MYALKDTDFNPRAVEANNPFQKEPPRCPVCGSIDVIGELCQHCKSIIQGG